MNFYNPDKFTQTLHIGLLSKSGTRVLDQMLQCEHWSIMGCNRSKFTLSKLMSNSLQASNKDLRVLFKDLLNCW